MSGATSIAVGNAHSCSVNQDAKVYCWGNNNAGQLGDGTITNKSSPTLVLGINNAEHIELGNGFSCAMLIQEAPKCWGYNASGQLGVGNSGGSLYSPTSVVNLGEANSISLGNSHSCAVVFNGSLKCWGDNSAGQLGDSTTFSRSSPASVSNFLTLGFYPAVPPAAPTVTVGVKTANSVSLTWVTADNGGSAVTDYVIQYSSNSGSTWTTFTDSISAATSATVTGLTRGTAYVFRVAAVNPEGVGGYSSQSEATVPSVVPGVPTGLVVTNKTESSIPYGRGRHYRLSSPGW
jgi:hypothetical protein